MDSDTSSIKATVRLHSFRKVKIVDLQKTSSIVFTDDSDSSTISDSDSDKISSSPTSLTSQSSESSLSSITSASASAGSSISLISMLPTEYVTKYDKHTPIIELMIKKRKATVSPTTKACYSHIACIYDFSLGEITDLVDGKCVFGENSERKPKIGAVCNTHAEVDAMRRYHGMLTSKRIKSRKVNVLVIRFNKSGNLCESAPCYHCSKKLNEDGLIVVDKLYYSRSDGSITGIKFRDWMKRDEFHLTRGWREIMVK